MTYFIIENHTRQDGIVETSTVSRATFASALSYYHERYSKMCVTELYKSVSLMLADENLSVIEQATIATQWHEEA